MDEIYIVRAEIPDSGEVRCSCCRRVIGPEENVLGITGNPPEIYCGDCHDRAVQTIRMVDGPELFQVE